MRVHHAALFALAAVLAGPMARAGVMIGGSGPKLVTTHSSSLRNATLQGHIRSLVWTDRTGRTQRERAPAGLNLNDNASFLPPAGEWVELTLVLDGPVTLTGTTPAGAPLRLSAELGTWTVPLESPEDRSLVLDLELPALLASPAELARALRDGALAR